MKNILFTVKTMSFFAFSGIKSEGAKKAIHIYETRSQKSQGLIMLCQKEIRWKVGRENVSLDAKRRNYPK